MRDLYQAFLHLLFPPTCLACHTTLVYQEEHLCLSCGVTLPSAELEIPIRHEALIQKFYGLIPFTHACALYYFSKKGRVQQLLHSLKYRHQSDALRFLGAQLGDQLRSQGLHTAFDLIIPVPLHPLRQQERGYNQSELLAEGIGQTLQIPVHSEMLIRRIHTTTQTAKTKQQRRDNMAEAFFLPPTCHRALAGKRILLVDDLVTTGATLTASAQCLLDTKAHSISFATLAVAL